MSDPLSVAGSAVGIISLGIQVSQGLYNYINSVRGRDKDLDTASTQVSHLLRTYQALSDLIPKIQSLPDPDTEVIETLRQCLQESERGVEELRVLLESLQNVVASDLKGKMKNTGRLLGFGLRREDLTQMQDNVLRLTETTELALQVINTNLGISHTQELAKLGESMDSQFTATHQRLQHLELKTEECGMHLRSTESIVETTSDTVITAVRSAKQETSADMQAMFEALTSLIITQHEQSQSQLADIETHQRKLSQTGARLLQKPAALRDLCDTAGYDHSELVGRLQFEQQGPMSSLCTCDLRQRETRTSAERKIFLGVIVYNQQHESFKHSAKCVFHKTQKRQDYGARFRVSFHHTLSFLVDLSLSSTSGAGGCSIAPQFRYKQMVQRSPASDLIRSLFRTFRPHSASNEIEDCDKHFALTERKLLRLFQDGKVSPCDMNSRGTLLHEAVLFGVISIDKALQMDLLSKVVKTLIRVGVPCGEPDNMGRNALSIFTSMLRYKRLNRGRDLEKARTIAADIAQSHDSLPFFNPTRSD
ncbi:hypothetical protein BGZ61DRAFT_585814, partial [Ilyonectria robusta]|uniref:uncharacterized protein n=1 Tax=Ilyonectria robusta TaxID=1079257 RepID=UPI001E8D2FB6